MSLGYPFLDLFSIVILVLTLTDILTIPACLFISLSALQYLFMFFIHLLHLLLLVLSSDFLTTTFNVLYIGCHFSVLPHFSQLNAVVFFGQKLTLLILIKPRDSFNVNIELLEGCDTFS